MRKLAYIVLLIMVPCTVTASGKNIIVDLGYYAPDGVPGVQLRNEDGTVFESSFGKRECAMQINFGSHSIGIDQEILGKVEAFFNERSDLVSKVYKQSWGREGEISLCPVIAEADDRHSVYEEFMEYLESLGTPQKGYIKVSQLAE